MHLLHTAVEARPAQ